MRIPFASNAWRSRDIDIFTQGQHLNRNLRLEIGKTGFERQPALIKKCPHRRVQLVGQFRIVRLPVAGMLAK
jgi:hypothetical protein